MRAASPPSSAARAPAGAEEWGERGYEEAADLLYHLAVLVRSRGLDLAGAMEVLNGRRGR